MGKKKWQPIDPTNFGYHVTIRHPSVNPSCKPMLDVTFTTCTATRTFREKKQKQSRVFFRLNFDVYADRERASGRDKNKGDEFRSKNNMKILWRR